MALADLTLETNPANFQSFFYKATDQETTVMVVVASKDYLRKALDAVSGPGLYILQADDSTLYVGQSKELASRLSAHRTTQKIGFTKLMAMTRDAAFIRYLDYSEARLYQKLLNLGFKLAQAPLGPTLEAKRSRLGPSSDHANLADKLLDVFLSYSVAFGLAPPAPAPKPAAPETSPDSLSSPTTPSPASPEEASLPVTEVAAAPEKALHKKNPLRLKLHITAPDGTVLADPTVANTLRDAIILAGPARVSALGLRAGGEALVSTVKPARFPLSSAELGEGWYLSSLSDTESKLKQVQHISVALGLGWVCELVNPDQSAPAECS